MENIDQVPIWLRKDLSKPAVARDAFHANIYELVPHLVRDGKKHKVAIICPGGGYNMVCSYVEGDPYADALNAMGISAVIVYYRCRELSAYPAPQQDLARAVAEVHSRAEEWDLDMTNYSVWGSSAGGHLASSFGTANMGYPVYDLPKPGAMILTYPVITMGEHTHEGTRDNLLQKENTPEMRAFTSVEQHVTADYPRTFLWCGDADSCVEPVNSRLMAEALEKAGVEHIFREYPGVEHGTGLAAGTAAGSWFQEATAFWLGAEEN